MRKVEFDITVLILIVILYIFVKVLGVDDFLLTIEWVDVYFLGGVLEWCFLRKSMKNALLEDLPYRLQYGRTVDTAQIAINTWYPRNKKMQCVVAHVCASAIKTQSTQERLVIIYHSVNKDISRIFRLRLMNGFQHSLDSFLQGVTLNIADYYLDPSKNKENFHLDQFFHRIDDYMVIYGSENNDQCNKIGVDAVTYLYAQYAQYDGSESFSRLAGAIFEYFGNMKNLSVDDGQSHAFLSGAKRNLLENYSRN